MLSMTITYDLVIENYVKSHLKRIAINVIDTFPREASSLVISINFFISL